MMFSKHTQLGLATESNIIAECSTLDPRQEDLLS